MKYLLFVTDGEPDRCDGGTPERARDDVIGAVQGARTQGIGTLLFGLGSGVFAQHLQDVANAGAGAPVGRPCDNAYDACFGGSWANAEPQSHVASLRLYAFAFRSDRSQRLPPPARSGDRSDDHGGATMWQGSCASGAPDPFGRSQGRASARAYSRQRTPP